MVRRMTSPVCRRVGCVLSLRRHGRPKRPRSSSTPTTPRRKTSRRSTCRTTTSSSRAKTPTGSTSRKGSLKKYKTVTVKEFDENGRGREARDAARDGQGLHGAVAGEGGLQGRQAGGELTIEGNVFNAWEPHGAARYWGGWAANPGVGMEVVAQGRQSGNGRRRRSVTRPRARRSGTPSRTASRTCARRSRSGK